MIGDATLVPPKTSQPLTPPDAKLSKTATPVFGSASADTSATARLAQPVLNEACPDSTGFFVEQPLPAPDQAVSDQPRELFARVSEVPPTAVTKCDDAGNCTPNPLSPVLAVTAMPGWW